ncbi:MAG: hypothetical protein WA970_03095 [Gammaproteobacteria bacterium]
MLQSRVVRLNRLRYRETGPNFVALIRQSLSPGVIGALDKADLDELDQEMLPAVEGLLEFRPNILTALFVACVSSGSLSTLEHFRGVVPDPILERAAERARDYVLPSRVSR